MTKAKKDQFVIACLECEDDAATVLPLARHCAAQLGKGLFVLNVSKEGDNDWIKNFGLPYVGLKGDWKTAVDGLPTVLGGVLAVTALNRQAPRSSITHPSTLLRTFADCKIAYLVASGQWSVVSGQWSVASGQWPVASGQWSVVSGQWPVASIGQQTLSTTHYPLSTYFTLDHRRESKEKLIWASYMVRFFGSKLTVATPDYRDAGFREKLRNNLQFTQKMYRSLGVDYTTTTIPASNFRSPDLTLVNSSLPSPESSLLVAMTTGKRDRDLGDLVAGPQELRLLKQSAVPILFLNQRDDLYVLCD